MRATAIAGAGLMLLTSGLALATVSSASHDAGKTVNANTADGDFAGSFTVAQKAPPRKQPQQQQKPNNDGWGDIDPYSFGGWSAGGNTG